MGGLEIGGLELAVIAVGVVGLPALVLWWARRPTGETEIHEWATAHGLRVTDANRDFVERYLRRAKAMRRTGGLVGWLAAPAVAGVVASPDSPLRNGFLLIIGGYLVGAVTAELTMPRPVPSGPRAALSPRRIGDYLPRHYTAALLAAGLTSAALVAVYAGASFDLPHTARWRNVPAAVLSGVLGVGVTAAALLLVRHTVHRPQPVVNDDMLAADDAVRASSAHIIIGGALGIVLLCVFSQLELLSESDPSRLRQLGGWLALPSMFGAWFTWLFVGHRRWRVRRRGLLEAPHGQAA